MEKNFYVVHGQSDSEKLISRGFGHPSEAERYINNKRLKKQELFIFVGKQVPKKFIENQRVKKGDNDETDLCGSET